MVRRATFKQLKLNMRRVLYDCYTDIDKDIKPAFMQFNELYDASKIDYDDPHLRTQNRKKICFHQKRKIEPEIGIF